MSKLGFSESTKHVAGRWGEKGFHTCLKSPRAHTTALLSSRAVMYAVHATCVPYQ
jgi:hypothetical protein